MADEDDPEFVPEPKPMPAPAKKRSAKKDEKTSSSIEALAGGAREDPPMTDEEYLQWLGTLARKHLQFGRLEELRLKRGQYLAEQIDRLYNLLHELPPL